MKNTLLIAFTALLLVSCSKDNDEQAVAAPNNQEMERLGKIDQLNDFIIDLGDEQATSQSGRNSNPSNFSRCASVTTVSNNNTWTRTVDFGNGCQYFNDVVLKGKIIYSGMVDFDEHEYTISYTFEDFYYDDINVDGNKSFSKFHDVSSLSNEEHPIYSLDIDLTVTYEDGDIYHRMGNKSREFVEGYNTTFNIFDNKYLSTGSWTTTRSNDVVFSSTILEPLEKKSICPYFRSGVIEIVYRNNTYNIDYGNGSCDNEAMLSYNGGTPYVINF